MDWRRDDLLSLAGVYKPRKCLEDITLPAALGQYLSDHPQIQKVILRLDNDAAGRLAAQTIRALLTRDYGLPSEYRPPPLGKDYNDFLCIRRGLTITRRWERSQAR